MSANTKIVVLRRKELLYTGIFVALGVLFILLLVLLLLPEKDSGTSSAGDPDTSTESGTGLPDNVADLERLSPAEDTSAGAVADNGGLLHEGTASNTDRLTHDGTVSNAAGSIANTYIPGIYTTELILGSETVNVEVIVNDHAITSVRLADPDATLTTMYPLLTPAMDSLSEQICETQDPEQVTYSSETRYTSLVLLEAVKASLEKAKPAATSTPDTSTTPSASPEANSTSAEPANLPNVDINPAA